MRLGVVHAAEVEGGTHVRLRPVDTSAMFHGIIEKNSDWGWTGEIQDGVGLVKLTDVELNKNQIRFTKTYRGRNYQIHYVLQPVANGFWSGTFHGETVGTGCVNMTVTEAPTTFFQPTTEYVPPPLM